MPRPLSLVMQQLLWKEINDTIQTVEDYECFLQELSPMNFGCHVVCVLVTSFLGFCLLADSLWALYSSDIQARVPRRLQPAKPFNLQMRTSSLSTSSTSTQVLQPAQLETSIHYHLFKINGNPKIRSDWRFVSPSGSLFSLPTWTLKDKCEGRFPLVYKSGAPKSV